MKLLDIFFKDRSLWYKFSMVQVLPIILATCLLAFVAVDSLETSEIKKEKARIKEVVQLAVLSLKTEEPLANRKLLNNIVDMLATESSVVAAMIIDPVDQVVLSHSNHEMDGKGIGEGTATIEKTLGQAPNGSYLLVEPIKKEDRIVAQLRVRATLTDVFREVSLIRKTVFTVTVFAALLGIVLSIFLSRLITRPVRAIALQARRIGDGDFGEEIEYKSKDAIGELANSFNTMAARLIAKQEQLQAINRVSATVYQSLDFHTVAKKAVDVMMAFSHARTGGIFSIDDESGQLKLLHTRVTQGEKVSGHEGLSMETALAGMAVETGRVITSEEVLADEHAKPEILLAFQGSDSKSAIVVPLSYRNKVLAAISLGFNGNNSLTENAKEILGSIGNTIGLAMANAQYVRQIQQEIGERNRAENALRKSENLFRGYFEQGLVGMAVTSPTREWIHANQRLCELLGYSLEELKLTTWQQLSHPEDIETDHLLFNQLLAGEIDDYSIDKRFLKKDGDVVYTMFFVKAVRKEDGTPEHLIAHLQDITARKKAEEERVRLAAAIEQAAELVIITDRQGRIEYVNPAFERISGYSKKEVMGKNPRLLKSGKHDMEFYQKMWATLTRGDVWTGHLINRKKDNTFYEEEASISPLLDHSGTITNFVAVKRDVTEEVHLEARVRQSQKMEAIGTLAGGIAHDFNNILSAVIGYTEIAIGSLERQASLYNILQEVLKAGERARDLVQQILAFSRQSEQERIPVQIRIIVKEVAKFLRASLPATIEIVQRIQSASTVLADPTQIHQVLMNLCANAEHSMRKSGGKLVVTLEDVNLDDVFTAVYPGMSSGPHIKLSVCDSGYGIQTDIVNRIFDPFFTTKSKSEGTGLGLSVVHGIVESHDGAVTVQSTPGEGTSFAVYLPVIQNEIKADYILKSPIPIGRENILFVDDEQAIADMAKMILKSLGYRVVVRTDSVEALKLFREKPGRFDLVITDMTMPKMTGFDLAEKLMAVRPDIPIILCTGFSAVVSEEEALAAGIRAFITKPILKRDIGEAIRNTLDRKLDEGVDADVDAG